MFRNYLKTALRNLSKQKFFTTLNVFGLAVGMSLNLLLVAMFVFIFQFDDFHEHGEQIYRVITHVKDSDENPSYASAPIGTVSLLQSNFSGIEQVVRIHRAPFKSVSHAGVEVSLDGYFADAGYFSMFSFPMVSGNPAATLARPNTMVITEAAASRIFGDKNPVGELISMEPYGEVMVTAVMKDMPKNTHLKAEALLSFATLTSHHGAGFTNDEKKWSNFYNSYVYLQVNQKQRSKDIEAFLNGFAKMKYTTPAFKASFELQRLDEIVPGPELDNDMGNEWSYFEMALMAVLPIIILFVACSNYVSLAISQSLKRMKEVGVRRVMGAEKRQIFTQFILESTLIMLLAVVLSYAFFEIIRNESLTITNSHESISLDPSTGTYIGFVVFAILVGLVAGIVPALYFSKIGPILALKGKELHKKTGGFFSLRKLVITLQFMLSLGFTFAVIIMAKQHSHSVQYDYGFEQDKIVNVDLNKAEPQRVKHEFGKLPFVSPVSLSSHALGATGVPAMFVKRPAAMDSIKVNTMAADENFIQNMGLQLLHGRNFTGNAEENARFIIINQTFANALSPAKPAAAIDQVIVMPDKSERRVAGVLADFHYANLKSPIANFFLEYAPEKFNYANFQLLTTNKKQAFAEMEMAWKSVGNANRFEADFLSNQIRDAYSFYNNIMKLWGFLGLLAITIACLGLLGTVVFTVRNRIKEVSIRKVMGASSRSLVYLLSRDFIVLLGIAAVITIPGVYLLFSQLMLPETQYYNAPIGAFEIVVSLAIVLALGLITIFSQTLRAANANPVDNLKVEG